MLSVMTLFFEVVFGYESCFESGDFLVRVNIFARNRSLCASRTGL